MMPADVALRSVPRVKRDASTKHLTLSGKSFPYLNVGDLRLINVTENQKMSTLNGAGTSCQ